MNTNNCAISLTVKYETLNNLFFLKQTSTDNLQQSNILQTDDNFLLLYHRKRLFKLTVSHNNSTANNKIVV